MEFHDDDVGNPSPPLLHSPCSSLSLTGSPPSSHSDSMRAYFSPLREPPPASSEQANHAVVSPCAACKILRRRCIDKCILAPYFPPSEPYKFTIAHRVFGASNIIKFLKELPVFQRSDAVSSMVYEAKARIRDPVYGSAGAICQLQTQISELQEQLAKAQAELVIMKCQQTSLISLLYMDTNINGTPFSHQTTQQQQLPHLGFMDSPCFMD